MVALKVGKIAWWVFPPSSLIHQNTHTKSPMSTFEIVLKCENSHGNNVTVALCAVSSDSVEFINLRRSPLALLCISSHSIKSLLHSKRDLP